MIINVTNFNMLFDLYLCWDLKLILTHSLSLFPLPSAANPSDLHGFNAEQEEEAKKSVYLFLSFFFFHSVLFFVFRISFSSFFLSFCKLAFLS